MCSTHSSSNEYRITCNSVVEGTDGTRYVPKTEFYRNKVQASSLQWVTPGQNTTHWSAVVSIITVFAFVGSNRLFDELHN